MACLARHPAEVLPAVLVAGETRLELPTASKLLKRLARAGNFYGDLPEMADAKELFEGVKQLKPTILTGLPRWPKSSRRWTGRSD